MSRQKIVFALCFLIAVGCQQKSPNRPQEAPPAATGDGGNRSGIDPKPGAQAPLDAGRSFEAAPVNQKGDLAVSDKSHVSLKVSALNKEFLLSANMLTQTPTPSFSALQSRIVSFIERDGKIIMLDVTKNNVIERENIPQTLLITEFPILSRNENSIVIDFNVGMSKIFVNGDWQAAEDQPDEAEYATSALQVSTSYLEEVKVTDEALFIKQIAQVSIAAPLGLGPNSLEPLEVRYQLKPYNPDKTFVPYEYTEQMKVGYFVANQRILPDGSTTVYATKWNEKKPIKFAISANTPQEYQPLLKEALEYWNKTLGAGAITVEQLTDKSITAPQFDKNILQWVDNDAAGFAYADAQVDPRSGELTSAQIFMTSVFTSSSDPKGIMLDDSQRPARQQRPTLKGFKSARFCQRDVRKELSKRTAMTGAVSPDAMKKAVNDYVYEVVAHEMGHVMGLRHNFAGSLVASYDYKDRQAWIAKMYQDKKAPENLKTSSSVMEYSLFEESAANGDMLRVAGAPALSYDEVAIKRLYKQESLPADMPLFCTDSQTETYADCVRHDAGKSIISASSGEYEYALNTTANRILRSYISAKKSTRPEIPLQRMNISSQALADRAADNLRQFMSLLKEGTRLIQVRFAKMPILETMAESTKEEERAFIASEIENLGGLEKLVTALPEDFSTKLVEKFNRLVETPDFTTGKRDDGSPFSFSDEEKQYMKQQVAAAAPLIHKKMILAEINYLTGNTEEEDQKKWDKSETSTKLAPILLSRFQKYVLSKTGETIKATIDVEKTEEKLQRVTFTNMPTGGVGFMMLPASGRIAGQVTSSDPSAPVSGDSSTPISSEPASGDPTKGSTPGSTTTRVEIELPIYTYDLAIRKKAAGIMGNSSADIGWAYVEKDTAENLYKEEGKPVKDRDAFKLELFEPAARNWVLEYDEVKNAIE
jgi:hypothetical protein